MKRRFLLSLVLLLLFVPFAKAQDAVTVWNGAARAAFDPSKIASVSNLVIERDRVRITLASGTIQFSQPVNGRVFAAAFQGQGQLQISVPDPREQQQLRLFTGEDGVSLSFTEAAFNFSADAFGDLSSKLTWGGAAAGNLENIYVSQMREQEEHGSPRAARVMQSLLSSDPAKDAFLEAYLKTANHGWMIARYDARESEEISLGRWADHDYVGQFDDWLSFPAEGRSSSDAFRDPLEKAVYAADGYQMHVNLSTDTELEATSTVKLQAHKMGERVLLFDLNANLRVDSVKDETGAVLSYFQAREPKDRSPTFGDYVAVILPAPLSSGEHSLVFHYAGKHVVRNAGSGNYFAPSYGWYPGTGGNFALRTNFDLTFTYPKGFLLVATGDKTGETPAGKETTSTWKSSIPLTVAGFAFGDYQVSTQKVGDVEVDAYVNRNQDDTLASWNRYLAFSAGRTQNTGQYGPVNEPPAAAVGTMNPANLIKAMDTEMANALRVFKDYYGPFPYDRVAVTNIPYSYGQGWPMLLYLSSLSFLDSTQRHAMGIRDELGLSDFFRAHEMSHQWWGHRVGWKSYHDQWMSEGFAQFSGNLYVQFREDPNKYLERIRLDKQQLLSKNRYGHVNESLGPIWMGSRLDSSNGPDAYNVVIYDKGGLVLHTLRMLMRDVQNADSDHFFKDMMKDFCQTYDNKAASTEDFKAMVEKHMVTSMDAEQNHRMDWFFNQYVYGTGVPEYKLNYTVEQAGDKWVVSGEAVQSGVPDGWKDEVRLYVQMQGKAPAPVGWLRIPGKTSPFKFQLAAKPERLSLNEYEDTLAVIK